MAAPHLTSGAALERVRVAFEQYGCRVTGTGTRLSAQCPVHDDRSPSVSITGIEGRVLLYCHAGCGTDAILATVHLTMADLFDEPRQSYRYDDGRTVFRSPQKKFWQQGNTAGSALFRLSKVKAAVAAGETVFVVEGEQDVLSLESLGVTATCSAMGAGKAAKFDWTPLRDAKVVLIPDRDEPGERHARDVLAILRKLDATVDIRIAARGKDAADHVAAGLGLDDLLPAILPGDEYVGNPTGEPMGETGGGGNLTAEEYGARVFEQAVDEEVQRLRVRAEATRRIRSRTTAPPPAPIRLDHLLAEPDEPVDYRVDQLWPSGGRVMLSAQAKTGKTTLVGGLIRSLADATPFLGTFDPTVPDGDIVLLDNEMDRRQIRRWLRDQGIRNTDRVHVIPLRGALSSFNILDPEVRASWAAVLRELDAEVVVFDCLRPVLDALGLSEDKDAGQFLVAYDELLAAAEATDSVLVHHMGHVGERARGSSRLRDWPDVEWRLTKEDPDDPTSPRYFAANGRDVSYAEQQLAYDPTTRHLSVAGLGNRKQAAVRGALPAVLDWIRDNPGASGNAIEKALTTDDLPRQMIRDAIRTGITEGLIATDKGPRNATLHHIPDSQFASSPDLAASSPANPSEFASSPYREANSHEVPSPPSSPPGLTCPQCGREAQRLITYPTGTQYCPRCAYPGQTDEDNR